MGDRAADLLDGMTAAEPPPTGHDAEGVAAAQPRHGGPGCGIAGGGDGGGVAPTGHVAEVWRLFN